MSSFAKPDLKRIDGNHIKFEQKGVVIVKESTPSGSGEVEFADPGCSLRIRCADHRPPVQWLKNKSNADATIVIENGGSLELHVVELKSKIDKNKWKDAIKQFEGSIESAQILMKFLELDDPKKVSIYISYSEDGLTAKLEKNPLSRKTLTGSKSPLNPLDSWRRERLDLLNFQRIQIQKLIRDPTTAKANTQFL